jgi:hypothetical protein
MLAEQKEEFEMFITKLTTSLSDSTDSAVRSLGDELKAFISTEVVQSQKDFIQLIDKMKEIDECKSLMFQAVMSEFHEQTEIIKQIDSKTSKIEPNHAEIISKLDTIINKPDKPGVGEIDLASNLPPCPLASKLYNRGNKTEIFAKLPDYKLSCIAGMAGVGKSTLAITYGHHRKQVHQAKVFIF